MVAGLQACYPQAAAALREFVAETGCPVLTTYKAKGVLSEYEPEMLGHYIGGVAEAPLMNSADLLLLYGFDPVEGPPQKWRYSEKPMVELTEHAFEFPLFKASVSVVGDIAAALKQVTPAIKKKAWDAAELENAKQALTDAARVPDAKSISPQQVIDAAAAALPANCPHHHRCRRAHAAGAASVEGVSSRASR